MIRANRFARIALRIARATIDRDDLRRWTTLIRLRDLALPCRSWHLMEDCLMHPTHDVEREAAKTFGLLALGLPKLCEEELAACKPNCTMTMQLSALSSMDFALHLKGNFIAA